MTTPTVDVRIVDGVAEHIRPVAAEYGSRPALVTDRTLAATGMVTPVAHALDDRVFVIDLGEPTSNQVGVLAAELAAAGIDVAVAVGGGSVIDTTKLAARLVSEPDGLPARLLSAAPFPDSVGAVVAVPTTAGSGAEVTRTAIVTHHGRKSWAWDERLRPEAAVLSAEMTASTPRPVALAAGLDAFSHALEAATGKRSFAAVRSLGFDAVATVYRLLPEVVRNGGAGERLELAAAAAAAGTAIDHCGTGIGHAVGHAVGSLVRVPHGLAVALGLRAGLAWTLERAPEAFDGLAARLSPGAATEDLPRLFEEFLDAVGFDDELRRHAAPDLDALVGEMGSEEHRPMRQNNARPIGDGDVREVARLALQGWGR
ncbi:MAG TPA: iron-containing alcohol dehydrogenase [Acidimicrobiia bacterium]|nr:iron-containing alcohol dehydrogenase [Acidimicrobiia bacterium]